jgi:CheY-like chemotaxis protein
MLPNQAPQSDWLTLIRRYQPRLAMQVFSPPRCLSQWQPLVACISSSEFCLQQLHEMQLPNQQCLSRKKLLVVDDNETNQAFIGLLLQHTAIDLQTALTGNEVFALCQQQQFDMILLDICLPDISGVEVARLLRQLPDYKSIPILAFTAHALPSEIAEFKLAGMDDILLKPLEPSKFETLLARYRLY